MVRLSDRQSGYPSATIFAPKLVASTKFGLICSLAGAFRLQSTILSRYHRFEPLSMTLHSRLCTQFSSHRRLPLSHASVLLKYIRICLAFLPVLCGYLIETQTCNSASASSRTLKLPVTEASKQRNMPSPNIIHGRHYTRTSIFLYHRASMVSLLLVGGKYRAPRTVGLWN